MLNDKELNELAKVAIFETKKELNIDQKTDLQEGYVAQPKVYQQVTDSLSERLKVSHKALYEAYVTQLSEVSAKIDACVKNGTNPNYSEFRSLKQSEAYLLNAVYLHELFFSNCFNPNSELYQDTLAYMRIQQDWGTFDKWMEEFQACASASRAGWAIFGWSTYLKKYINIAVDNHVGNIPVGFIPVLAVDVWEHAYMADYGLDKDSYVVAMMREIDWDVIEERIQKIDKIAEALK